MHDLREFIETTRAVLSRIDSQTDTAWTKFQTSEVLKSDIEKDLCQLENGDLTYLKKVYIHFLPTSTFQEVFIDDEWETEYLDIASRMDELYARLRPIEKKQTTWDLVTSWIKPLIKGES